MLQPLRTECFDKLGRSFEIARAQSDDHPALVRMYDLFEPKAVTQGLPPANEKSRFIWVNGLLKDGVNFLAWKECNVVGHSSLIPDHSGESGEYLIFVNHEFRNQGLGTQLTRYALSEALLNGMSTIWLTVEALNFRAIKLYKKIGFTFCDSGERERTMILHL
jgi:ribosomal protein S18 acetylase RimI-like enzyme